jgi:hypothetical protein
MRAKEINRLPYVGQCANSRLRSEQPWQGRAVALEKHEFPLVLATSYPIRIVHTEDSASNTSEQVAVTAVKSQDQGRCFPRRANGVKKNPGFVLAGLHVEHLQ